MDHILLLVLVGIFVSGRTASVPSEKIRDPDMELTAPELIAKYGFPIEEHVVMTEDGYALGLQRIPHGRGQQRGERPAVLVQHGLTASSACWLLNNVDNSLAYMLADAGYDVWLGNVRGNTYSRMSTPHKDPKDNEYWMYSWHECGMYDLPAMIDHITNVTGQQKIFYIGHSMGTTMFYVMASERPEYNDKIRAMFSLAPVAYMSKLSNKLVKLLSVGATELGAILNLIGVYEFLPESWLYKELGQAFCNEDAKYKELCENICFLILGFDSENFNASRIPVYLSHLPQGCSTRQWVHYGQEVRSGKFGRFDFGLFGNLFMYGSFSPPSYDLSKITAPVSLHYADKDSLAAPEDVWKLYNALPNPVGLFRVPRKSFNHIDFIVANDAKELLYDPLIQLMKTL